MDLYIRISSNTLSLAARAFTAFITFCGIFHYLRLPSVLRAPPYFQEMMAAVVLAGLVYFICEDLDDCIVHAPDNQTFLQNLGSISKDLVSINFF
jgi:hypothetical protein